MKMTHEGDLNNPDLIRWTLQLESERNTGIKDLTSEFKADVALLNNVTNKLSSLFVETERQCRDNVQCSKQVSLFPIVLR